MNRDEYIQAVGKLVVERNKQKREAQRAYEQELQIIKQELQDARDDADEMFNREYEALGERPEGLTNGEILDACGLSSMIYRI